MKKLYVLPLVLVMMAFVIFLFTREFLAPQVKEIRMGIDQTMSQKFPAALEKFRGFVLFRLSDAIEEVYGPYSMYFGAGFLLLPVGLKMLIKPLEAHIDAEWVFLIISGMSVFLLMLTVFDLGLSGLNATILLPLARKYGG